MNIKKIPNDDKPRERLTKVGERNLSNEELIQIILKSGNRKYSLKEISYNIVKNIEDIRMLRNITVKELLNIKGISEVKAIELVAAIELGRRVYEDISIKEVISCTSPDNIVGYFNELFKGKVQEEFYVIYLDNKKNYIYHKLLFIGSINYSIIHPRDIFREAYITSSSYIICIHNHPSGDPSPSNEDIKTTKKIKELGLMHSIPLVDHIILGNNKYYSFFEDNNL